MCHNSLQKSVREKKGVFLDYDAYRSNIINKGLSRSETSETWPSPLTVLIDSKSQQRKIPYIFFIGRKNVEALNYQKNTESIRNTERVIFNVEITVLKQMLTDNNATYCSAPSWKYSFSTWNSILCITLLQQ